MWPLNVFFLFKRTRFCTPKIKIWLSIDWQANHFSVQRRRRKKWQIKEGEEELTSLELTNEKWTCNFHKLQTTCIILKELLKWKMKKTFYNFSISQFALEMFWYANEWLMTCAVCKQDCDSFKNMYPIPRHERLRIMAINNDQDLRVW